MSLNSKYRMRDISKDFDLKINKIQEILAKFESGVDSETYKSMRVLTDEELGMVFDYLTQTNKGNDMKLFFDDCVREKEEREKLSFILNSHILNVNFIFPKIIKEILLSVTRKFVIF